MGGLIVGYLLIKPVGVLDRAVLGAGGTAGAYVLVNVSGLPDQGYMEVPGLPFHLVNLGIGQYLYVGVPFTLDKLGRLDSH